MELENGHHQPAIWLIRAGRKGRFAADFEAAGVIAIGWPLVGNLEGLDREELVALVEHHYGSKGAPGKAGMLYRFANEIAVGDLVLMPDSETRKIYAGEICGPYEYRAESVVGGYPNLRQTRWTKEFSRDLLPKRILYQLGSLLTVSQPSSQDDLWAFLRASEHLDSSDGEVVEGGTDDDPSGTVDLYEELASQTGELIRAKIAELDGYETQDLVAGILRSMGYFTQVSSVGKDGGIDIIASKDPIGVETPIIKVQVKSRPGDSARATDVRALAGLITTDERGVFVSTGGYTRDARRDGQLTGITLIDMDRLVELFLESYETLDQDTKSLVPLRRIYVP